MSPPCLDNMASISVFHIIPSLLLISVHCMSQPWECPGSFSKVFFYGPYQICVELSITQSFNVFFVTMPLGSLGKYYPIFADGTHQVPYKTQWWQFLSIKTQLQHTDVLLHQFNPLILYSLLNGFMCLLMQAMSSSMS